MTPAIFLIGLGAGKGTHECLLYKIAEPDTRWGPIRGPKTNASFEWAEVDNDPGARKARQRRDRGATGATEAKPDCFLGWTP